MMKQTLKVASIALLGLLTTTAMAQQKPPRLVVYKFFDDQYRQGGFDYAYGGSSKGVTITKDGGYKSKSALNIKLDPSEYSGASICLYNEFFDLNKYMLDSKIEFMIKGKKGGESVKVGLLDDEVGDGKKTQVVLPMNKYIEGGAITTDWKKVSIPLVDFPDRGLLVAGSAPLARISAAISPAL